MQEENPKIGKGANSCVFRDFEWLPKLMLVLKLVVYDTRFTELWAYNQKNHHEDDDEQSAVCEDGVFIKGVVTHKKKGFKENFKASKQKVLIYTTTTLSGRKGIPWNVQGIFHFFSCGCTVFRFSAVLLSVLLLPFSSWILYTITYFQNNDGGNYTKTDCTAAVRSRTWTTIGENGRRTLLLGDLLLCLFVQCLISK